MPIQKSKVAFALGFASVILLGALLGIYLGQRTYNNETSSGKIAAAPTAEIAQNDTGGSIALSTVISPNVVSGPTFYLGCVGNQTVFILPGNHPANSSDIFYNPQATQDAQKSHEYCANGNLVNATSGQIIPFPQPS